MKHSLHIGLIGLVVAAAVGLGVSGQDCAVLVGPGESIQEAIDAAPEGATICLAAGTWEENLELGKSLTLRGAGAEQTTIQADRFFSPVVHVAGSGTEPIDVQLSGVTLTGATGFNNAALRIEGAARATVEGCAVVDNGHGIDVMGDAEAHIIDCSVLDNYGGIGAMDNAVVHISGCRIEGNEVGVLLADAAEATIARNVIQGHLIAGIASISSAVTDGEDNAMSDNAVDLVGNVRGPVRRPLVEATEGAIAYPDPRFPTLQHAVDALHPDGVLVVRAGVHEAAITVGKRLTLVAEEGSEAVLRGVEPEAILLSVVGGADLAIVRLRLDGAGVGLFGGADARVSLSECTVAENEVGVGLIGEAFAVVTRCEVLGNEIGIGLAQEGRAMIADCTLAEGDTGVLLEGSSEATLERCTLSENEVGLSLLEASRARILGCEISGNYGNGIEVVDNARATVTGCRISGNGEGGILLEDAAELVLGWTTIEANRRFGVALYERPCFPTSAEFSGYVSGRGNTIVGLDEAALVGREAFCPLDLIFLTTDEGGSLDRRP